MFSYKPSVVPRNTRITVILSIYSSSHSSAIVFLFQPVLIFLSFSDSSIQLFETNTDILIINFNLK